MNLLGNPVAQKIENEEILSQTKQNHNHLAIILVGNNRNSEIYVREKVKASHKLGIEVSVYRFPEAEDIIKIQETIRYLNEDKDIAGIIMQLPLPDSLISETDQLMSLIYQSKDVDSLTEENKQFDQKITISKDEKFSQRFKKLKELYQKNQILIPPTATAIMEILNYYKVDLKEALLVGRGLLVGTPVAKLLNQISIPYKVIHSQTNVQEKKKLLKEAKVIISGTSSPESVFTSRDLSDKVTIIDCAGDYKDIDSKKDQSFTPLIGGVGPVTVACLLRNVVKAKLWQK